MLGIIGLADKYHPTESDIPRYISARTSAAQLGDTENVLISTVQLSVKYHKHFDMTFNAKQNPPLHVAAYEGNLTAVKRCIEVEGCDPLQLNERGYTALHVATYAGYLNIIKYLVEDQGVNPAFCSESDSLTPLHIAVVNINLPLVKYFVGLQQIDPLCLDGLAMSPLHYACETGNLEIVKYLIDEAQMHEPIETFINIKCLQTGDSLVHSAASSGNLDVVKFLTETCNASPYTPNLIGDTPVHAAASRGHTEIVKFLTIDKKCDPKIKNSLGCTALHCASTYGTVEFLLTKFEGLGDLVDNNNCTPLHQAVLSGDLDVVKLLTLHNPASAVSRDKDGNTPLHYAAPSEINVYHSLDPDLFVATRSVKDQCAIIEFLTLERKCDPTCKNNDGKTPLHLAALYGCLPVVKLLISNLKCDPNALDVDGAMPIHLACQGGYTNVVRYLLNISVSVTSQL